MPTDPELIERTRPHLNTVVMCSFPNRVGSEQARRFELTGERLVPRTPPVRVGGKLLVHEFLWQREEV